MSRAASLVLLCCVAGVLGCSTSNFDDFEKEGGDDRDYLCAPDHPCPKDIPCVDGHCLRPEPIKCTPGAVVACGSNVGQCRQGTTTCTAQGTPGTDCMGGTKPVLESCNGLDDDCDGLVDTVSQFGRAQDDLTSVGGTIVNGSPLLLTIKSGTTLQLRSLNKTGEVTNTGNSIEANRNTRASLPTLVAVTSTSGGTTTTTVLAAWIERSATSKLELAFGVVSPDKNGDWQLPSSVIRSDMGVDLNYATELALAFNSRALLALVTTSDQPPNAEITNAPRHTWAVYRAMRGAVDVPVASQSLGTPTGHFGLAVVGQGGNFLVSYEDDKNQKVALLPAVDGKFGSRMLDTGAHRSPFILPDSGTSTGYSVYYARNYSSGSEIISMHCSGVVPGNCDAAQVLFRDKRFIARMSLTTPLTTAPTLAVFSWGAEAEAAEKRGLAATKLSSSDPPPSAFELAPSTSSERLLMTESNRWVVFTKVLSPDNVNSTSEVSLQRFCIPPP